MFNEMIQKKILVVDDESGIREGLKSALEQLGYAVTTAPSGERALYEFKQSPDISFVLSDYKMPGLTGFDLLKEIKKQSPQTKVVLMTGFGSVHHAVSAMQMGADDYLCKPFAIKDLEKIIIKSQPMVSQIKVESTRLLTESMGLQSILKRAERAAQSNAPILIEGPSGTGKELLAKQIHDWSSRRDRPWVAVNCAALPAGLLESELFGFERGAFTGALEKKPGKFEQAHGGTLLLDEIGELDPLLQAKLLRVLQEGEVDRLGGKKSIKVDVRIIATTNRNLEQLVHEDKFREDLFFRLYGVRFTLPALRERPEDIRLLAEEFLARQSKQQGRDLKYAEGVVEALQLRSWPGNVRELEKAVERAAVFAESALVRLEHFDFVNQTPPSFSSLSSIALKPLGSSESQKSMRDMEREIIFEALNAHQGNRTHTAKSLGMSLRTLRHKLKLYREAGFIAEADRQKELGKFDLEESHDAMLSPMSGASKVGIHFALPGGGREV